MKTSIWKHTVILGLIFTSFTFCKKEESTVRKVKVDYVLTDYSKLEQYTPNQADWNSLNSKPLESGLNKSHAPDDIGWISKETWEKAKWDGTVYDPTKYSRKEFAELICPEGQVIRGLREVFYATKPFKDNRNPTKAEVDEWHRIAINHIRSLVGYISEDRQVKKDYCLFARALWGDQRLYTTIWDSKYPAGDKTQPHYGASFIPDEEDQRPYLPDGFTLCGKTQGAEGMFNASKSDIPWSIKFVRSFSATLGQEGFWGGHIGPWFHREKFGFSFWDDDPSNHDNNVALRAKWSGKLMSSEYKNPNGK